jgi:hypothetical protein
MEVAAEDGSSRERGVVHMSLLGDLRRVEGMAS